MKYKQENYIGRLLDLDLWKNKTYLELDSEEKLKSFWQEIKSIPESAFFCTPFHQSILHVLLSVKKYYRKNFFNKFSRIIQEYIDYCKEIDPQNTIINWHTSISINFVIKSNPIENIQPNETTFIYDEGKNEIWLHSLEQKMPRKINFKNQEVAKAFKEKFTLKENRKATWDEVDLLIKVSDIADINAEISLGITLLTQVLFDIRYELKEGLYLEENRIQMVELLIKNGLQANVINHYADGLSNFYTSLCSFTSSAKNNLKVLDSLISYDKTCDINFILPDNHTALSRSLFVSGYNVKHLLVLKYFSHIRIEDLEKYFKLYGHEILYNLVKKEDDNNVVGAFELWRNNVNNCDEEGNTITHHLINKWIKTEGSHDFIDKYINFYGPYIKFIAFCGAKPTIKNKKNDSAVDLVLKKNDIKLIKLFFDNFPGFFEEKKLNNEQSRHLYIPKNVPIHEWLSNKNYTERLNTDFLIKTIDRSVSQSKPSDVSSNCSPTIKNDKEYSKRYQEEMDFHKKSRQRTNSQNKNEKKNNEYIKSAKKSNVDVKDIFKILNKEFAFEKMEREFVEIADELTKEARTYYEEQLIALRPLERTVRMHEILDVIIDVPKSTYNLINFQRYKIEPSYSAMENEGITENSFVLIESTLYYLDADKKTIYKLNPPKKLPENKSIDIDAFAENVLFNHFESTYQWKQNLERLDHQSFNPRNFQKLSNLHPEKKINKNVTSKFLKFNFSDDENENNSDQDELESYLIHNKDLNEQLDKQNIQQEISNAKIKSQLRNINFLFDPLPMEHIDDTQNIFIKVYKEIVKANDIPKGILNYIKKKAPETLYRDLNILKARHCIGSIKKEYDHCLDGLLHHACQHSFPAQYIYFLIQQKANPNLVKGDKKTPLTILGRNKYFNLDIVRILVDNKADINYGEKSKKIETLLSKALLNKSPSFYIRQLLELKANPNVNTYIEVKKKDTKKNGLSTLNQSKSTLHLPLIHAAGYYNSIVLQELIDHKADITVLDSEGRSILHFIAASMVDSDPIIFEEHAKSIVYLLEYKVKHGIDLPLKDKEGRHFLMCLPRNDNVRYIEFISYIIQNYTETKENWLGALYKNNHTLISYELSLEQPSLVILDALYEKNSSDNLRSGHNETLIYTLCRNLLLCNNPLILDKSIYLKSLLAYLKKILDPNDENARQFIDYLLDSPNGISIIHLLVKQNDINSLSFLLNTVCFPEFPCDNQGKTPLIYACLSDYPNSEILEILLKKDKNNIDHKDKSGKTALYYLLTEKIFSYKVSTDIQENLKKCFNLLVQYGAQKNMHIDGKPYSFYLISKSWPLMFISGQDPKNIAKHNIYLQDNKNTLHWSGGQKLVLPPQSIPTQFLQIRDRWLPAKKFIQYLMESNTEKTFDLYGLLPLYHQIFSSSSKDIYTACDKFLSFKQDTICYYDKKLYLFSFALKQASEIQYIDDSPASARLYKSITAACLQSGVKFGLLISFDTPELFKKKNKSENLAQKYYQHLNKKYKFDYHTIILMDDALFLANIETKTVENLSSVLSVSGQFGSLLYNIKVNEYENAYKNVYNFCQSLKKQYDLNKTKHYRVATLEETNHIAFLTGIINGKLLRAHEKQCQEINALLANTSCPKDLQYIDYYPIIQLLLADNSNLNALINNETLLNLCLRNRPTDIELITFLLSKKPDPNLGSDNLDLLLKSQAASLELVELLLAAGMKVHPETFKKAIIDNKVSVNVLSSVLSSQEETLKETMSDIVSNSNKFIKNNDERSEEIFKTFKKYYQIKKEALSTSAISQESTNIIDTFLKSKDLENSWQKNQGSLLQQIPELLSKLIDNSKPNSEVFKFVLSCLDKLDKFEFNKAVNQKLMQRIIHLCIKNDKLDDETILMAYRLGCKWYDKFTYKKNEDEKTILESYLERLHKNIGTVILLFEDLFKSNQPLTLNLLRLSTALSTDRNTPNFIKEINKNEGSLLHWMAQGNIPLDLFKFYFDKHTETFTLKSQNKLNRNFLHWICQNPYINQNQKLLVQLVGSLLNKGIVAIDEKDDEGNTCLHLACKNPKTPVYFLNLLVRFKGDLAIENNKKETCLDLLMKNENISLQEIKTKEGSLLRFVLKQGCNSQIRNLIQFDNGSLLQRELNDSSNMHILEFVCTQENLASSIIELMLKYDHDQTIPTATYERSWRFLFQKKEIAIDVIKLFLNKSPNLDINLPLIQCSGNTLLHQAVNQNDVGLVKFLLNKNANLNQFNENGETPIHLAFKKNRPNFEIINALLPDSHHIESLDKSGKQIYDHFPKQTIPYDNKLFFMGFTENYEVYDATSLNILKRLNVHKIEYDLHGSYMHLLMAKRYKTDKNKCLITSNLLPDIDVLLDEPMDKKAFFNVFLPEERDQFNIEFLLKSYEFLFFERFDINNFNEITRDAFILISDTLYFYNKARDIHFEVPYDNNQASYEEIKKACMEQIKNPTLELLKTANLMKFYRLSVMRELPETLHEYLNSYMVIQDIYGKVITLYFINYNKEKNKIIPERIDINVNLFEKQLSSYNPEGVCSILLNSKQQFRMIGSQENLEIILGNNHIVKMLIQYKGIKFDFYYKHLSPMVGDFTARNFLGKMLWVNETYTNAILAIFSPYLTAIKDFQKGILKHPNPSLFFDSINRFFRLILSFRDFEYQNLDEDTKIHALNCLKPFLEKSIPYSSGLEDRIALSLANCLNGRNAGHVYCKLRDLGFFNDLFPKLNQLVKGNQDVDKELYKNFLAIQENYEKTKKTTSTVDVFYYLLSPFFRNSSYYNWDLFLKELELPFIIPNFVSRDLIKLLNKLNSKPNQFQDYNNLNSVVDFTALKSNEIITTYNDNRTQKGYKFSLLLRDKNKQLTKIPISLPNTNEVSSDVRASSKLKGFEQGFDNIIKQWLEEKVKYTFEHPPEVKIETFNSETIKTYYENLSKLCIVEAKELIKNQNRKEWQKIKATEQGNILVEHPTELLATYKPDARYLWCLKLADNSERLAYGKLNQKGVIILENLNTDRLKFSEITSIDYTIQRRVYAFCKLQSPFSLLEQFAMRKLPQWRKIKVEYQSKLCLNENQKNIIQSFVSSANGIYCLEGPPGTGKTTTILGLLEVRANQEQQTLICAVTNKAVQVLAERFIKAFPDIPVALIGVAEKMPQSLLKIYASDPFKLHIEEINMALNGFGKDLNTLSEKSAEQLVGAMSQIKDIYSVDTSISNDLTFIIRPYQIALSLKSWFNDKDEILLTNKQKDAIEEFKKLFNELKNILQKDPIKKELEKERLKKAKFIFSTLNTAPKLAHTLTLKPEMIILDEASQAREIDLLSLFLLDPKKLFLAGDTKQIQPMPISSNLKKLASSNSYMWNVMNQGQPFVMLREQFRMHPNIFSWANKTFYDNNVINNPTVLSQKYPNLPIRAFIDVKGQEKFEQGSFKNVEEAALIVKWVKILMKTLQQSNLISIITFYRAQVLLLKDLLDKENLKDINVNTVDAFQGEENEVVILSGVRGNEENEIGFLEDKARVNVAYTRGQHNLTIFGNAKTLASSKPRVTEEKITDDNCWPSLIEDMKSSKVFFSEYQFEETYISDNKPKN